MQVVLTDGKIKCLTFRDTVPLKKRKARIMRESPPHHKHLREHVKEGLLHPGRHPVGGGRPEHGAHPSLVELLVIAALLLHGLETDVLLSKKQGTMYNSYFYY
jgi:hypothetical protein